MALSSVGAAIVAFAFNPGVLANCYDVYAAAVVAICYLWMAAVIYSVALVFLVVMAPRTILPLSQTRLDTKLPLRSLCVVAICIHDAIDLWIRSLSSKGWVPLLSLVWIARAVITGGGISNHCRFNE